MADDELTRNQDAASVADHPDAAAPLFGDEKLNDKRKKDEDDDLEYEVEFATPFGKLEFEFEPLANKEKKDRVRKAKAERDTAKKTLKAAQKAARQGGGGFFGKLLIVLLVLGLVGAAVAAAYWLFARPGDEDADVIPPEFANDPQGEPVPPGFAARARSRISSAVSAGRHASRDAQREQREKFDQMTGR